MLTRATARSLALRLIRREDGAAMVEYAIIATLLFTLIFGIIDFGRAMFLYNNLANAARDAARYASVYNPDPCAFQAQIVDSARKLVQDFHGTTVAIPDPIVTCLNYNSGRPAIVRVEIANVPFRPVTPFPFLQNRTMTQVATVRNEAAVYVAP